jgi:erythronate-4-phosphate dehydrogenase
MHTPLTKDGDWPTYHLIKAEQLALLKDNAILLNAGRGAAIKGDDLLTCLQQRSDIQVVLDVWEAEPFVDPKLARLVKIATPHIAGYSLEGKVRGTFMLKNALYNWLDLPSNNLLEDYLPPTDIVSVNVARTIKPLDLMNIVYDPYVDDRALRAALSLKNPQSAFDSLRKNYRIRREFSALQVTGELASIERMQLLNWGFSEGC